MTTLVSPWRLWWLLVAFVAAWYLSLILFPALYFFVGVNHLGFWFLDTYAILASNDAISIGRDVWIPNPLDPFHRPHVYSHWWLHLHDLGLTRAQNFWLGFTFVAAFFSAALARLRPRAPGELVWYLAIVCSSPIVLAVDRANNDLLVFAVLAPVVPCLLSERRAAHLLAALLIGVAAGLKFYPAIAGLVLLARGNARAMRLRVAICALVLAAVGFNIAPDLVKFAGVAPKAEGLMTFAAVNVFEAAGIRGRSATLLGLVVGALAITAFLRARLFDDWEIAPADRGAWLSFVLGAVLLTGCFFTGTNYAYRWIFAVWLAPLLWRLPRDPATPPGVRRLARLIAVLLLVALWADPAASAVLGAFTGRVEGATLVRLADRFFLCEQPFTWALFLCLLGFLAHFTREGVRTLFARPEISASVPSAR